MKRKNILQTIVIVAGLLFIPVVASADSVSWSSEQYSVNYWMSSPYRDQTVSGSLLPLTIGTCPAYQIGACASISSTQMYTNAYVSLTDQGAGAKTSFVGTYTALDDKPQFQFTYTLAYGHTSDTSYSYPNGTYAWLTVMDSSDNNILYSNNLLPISSSLSTISINTTPGHEIYVDFGTRAWTDTWLDRNPTTSGARGAQALTLNYSTALAVVPEPISYILFVTGGTLLAGRRYLRRKV